MGLMPNWYAAAVAAVCVVPPPITHAPTHTCRPNGLLIVYAMLTLAVWHDGLLIVYAMLTVAVWHDRHISRTKAL